MLGIVRLLQHNTINFGRGVHCGCCHYRALLGVAVVVALVGGTAAAFGVAHAGVGVGAVSIVTKGGGHGPPVTAATRLVAGVIASMGAVPPVDAVGMAVGVAVVAFPGAVLAASAALAALASSWMPLQ